MDPAPDIKSPNEKTWLVVGASRGIGHEFVRQLLAREERVIATVRLHDADRASKLWGDLGEGAERLKTAICDISSAESIEEFVETIQRIPNLDIDCAVLNAGVLRYPNRATELSFDEFAFHLHTNTIGPILTAQKLLKAKIPMKTILFMSSDSGSAANFLEKEDGFGAYAASKAALNQMMRHMAAELKRAKDDTILLAVHPGEVDTDMANVDLPWEVEGSISPEESVSAMLKLIPTKTPQQSGTFWTWEDNEYPW
ncbi:NAD(P)-binding protein [Microthyrium microscopicum]|uniref:NAD(P)-binding protein n=1 Tax=Microthyrium microscopicum TaxID=703497 RepID=A0A6A6TYB6_9PEZI|nr:NAD(P)-binding protein [Microthyrium microscopicum]